MPRKKTATSSTPASGGSHKRGISTSSATNTSTPGLRSSKRIKTEALPVNTKVAPVKSKYFEAAETETESENEQTIIDEESGYEDEDATASEPSDVPSESDDYNSEDDPKPKKRARKSIGAKENKENTTIMRDDLWKEGVKTGLGPGKQVIIAKPKPRGDGGIKYQPDKIHPNTMAFLADLKKNNDREWLKMHDPDFRQSWRDWESFVDTLTEKIAEVDETIPELPPKDLVFRIYRDIRFSKDPTPYKTHFSAAWSRTGRKGPYAAYYVQIQPGGRSFVGSGLWNPDAQPLSLIRRSIDRRPERFRTLLVDAGIRKQLFGGIPKDEKKAIKAFTAQNAENALKSKPKGYEVDHPNIELLRLRNFTMGKRLTDEEMLGPDALSKVMSLVEAMSPFVTFLNSIVMPDDPDEDDDDDDDDDEGNENENIPLPSDDDSSGDEPS